MAARPPTIHLARAAQWARKSLSRLRRRHGDNPEKQRVIFDPALLLI